MTSTPRGPKILKGAFVSIAQGGQAKVLPFQFNPSNLKRTLKPQMVGGEEGDRSMAVRFKGAPVQTLEVVVEFDASSALDMGKEEAVEHGVYAQIAALELFISPSTDVINTIQSQLSQGLMEVAIMTAPALYFVWGKSRVLPVRIEQYSITEELFDGNLNPIQVSVSVSMRVLTYSDLDSSNHSYHQYQVYQQTMETIAANAYGSLKSLGVNHSAFN